MLMGLSDVPDHNVTAKKVEMNHPAVFTSPLTSFGKQKAAFTAAFCLAIAALLSLLGFGGTFWENLLFSQCVGFSIMLSVRCFSSIQHRINRRNSRLSQTLVMTAGLFMGGILGTTLGALMVGTPSKWQPISLLNPFLWRVVGISMMFGTVIYYFIHTREKLAQAHHVAQEERIRRLNSDKLAIETDLKRLQAQVEPHFLFNTLSNILSLMETDIDRAKAMQMDLIQYLRTSLKRSRNRVTTLGEEMDLIEAYLNIFKIRMGRRLEFDIAIADALRDFRFPPLLLQPIVENALLHGLEPKIEGGELHIRTAIDNGQVIIEISDTGVGLPQHVGAGVGLTNVQSRLAQLYGDQAKLTLNENQPGGMKVTIAIPAIDPRSLPPFPNPTG